MKYDPWLDAAQRYPEVHIDWKQTIAPFRGVWCPDDKVILINKGMTRAEGRCALAHELAHIDAGDRSTQCGWFALRQESRADVVAAHRLIDLDGLLEATRWSNNAGELAEALEVTVDVLALRVRTLSGREHIALVQARSRVELVA